MKQKLTTLFLCLTFWTTSMTAQGFVTTTPGSLTFDPSGWLYAVEEVYATYDQVRNTIVQIENQYRQIEHAINAVKSIDWDIATNGDWDIRGEIRDATSKVNRVLTSVRKIKNTINRPFVNLNGFSYSLADMCGVGGDGKNLITGIKDMTYELDNHFHDFCMGVAGQVTPEQRKAIYIKYGISPENYVMVQQGMDLVKNACSKIFSKVNEEAEKIKIEEEALSTNQVMQAVYATQDENGNPTTAAMLEGGLHMGGLLAQYMKDMERAFNDSAALSASYIISEQQKEVANKKSEEEQVELQKRTDSRTPTQFKLEE